LNKFIDRPALLEEPAAKCVLADARQRPPEFRLKNDKESNDTYCKKLCQDPVDGVEFQNLGNIEYDRNDDKAHEDLNRTSALKKTDEIIDKTPYKQDLENRTPNRQDKFHRYFFPNKLNTSVKIKLKTRHVVNGK
ncbi:MAG: hypothetical protein PHN49_10060, partial [Candidatus Omnitrophica bacterium]|nr:hypothetical protein [Candidatus Omnitrophota bacterium]